MVCLVMPRTVLVTGGAGFIGSWTVELLVEKGYRVIIYDNFSTGSMDNVAHLVGRVKIVRGDIRNSLQLEEVVKHYGVDSIIHLAALVSVVEAAEKPLEALQINVYGTHNVLEAARRHDLERVVYASSAAVYGDPKYLPIDEDHPLNPKNIYGATKLGGEALVNSYHENYGLSTISLRYFNVYGPRMKPGPYAGVILKFIERIKQGKPPIIYGDGTQTRDFIYVEDVARANLVALESNATGPYNIGTGIETSINQLAKTIAELMGRPDLKPIYTQPRPGDIKRSVAKIEKAGKRLGWIPSIGIEEGVGRIINII